MTIIREVDHAVANRTTGPEWIALFAGDTECSQCRAPIGFVLVGDTDDPGWRTLFEVSLEGDAQPTLFCEDCFLWLRDVAAGWSWPTPLIERTA